MLKIIDKEYLKNMEFYDRYEEGIEGIPKEIKEHTEMLSCDDTTKDTYTRILESGHIGINYEGFTQFNTIFDKLYDLIVAGKIVKVDYKKGIEEIKEYFKNESEK